MWAWQFILGRVWSEEFAVLVNPPASGDRDRYSRNGWAVEHWSGGSVSMDTIIS